MARLSLPSSGVGASGASRPARCPRVVRGGVVPRGGVAALRRRASSLSGSACAASSASASAPFSRRRSSAFPSRRAGCVALPAVGAAAGRPLRCACRAFARRSVPAFAAVGLSCRRRRCRCRVARRSSGLCVLRSSSVVGCLSAASFSLSGFSSTTTKTQRIQKSIWRYRYVQQKL